MLGSSAAKADCRESSSEEKTAAKKMVVRSAVMCRMIVPPLIRVNEYRNVRKQEQTVGKPTR